MGLFDKFKKKTESPAAGTAGENIASPISGTLVAQGDLKDPVFSQGIMGITLGVEPDKDGRVLSPVNGTVAMVFPTGHAVGLKAEDGTEILIHIGIDTVNLNGEGFHCLVKDNRPVHQGDVLVEYDPGLVRSRSLDPVVMTIITDQAGHEWKPVDATGSISAGSTLFTK